MMNRKEFDQYLQDNVKDYLPPSFEDAKIVFNEIVKNNDQHMTGMAITRNGEKVVPNIYIEPFYHEYQMGKNIDEIVGDIADVRIEYDANIQAETITKQLMNYEDVKDKLEIHLCDTEKNSNRLQGMIHTEHGDFSATYHIRISDMTQDGVASTPVTPQHMETWGITTDQLHQDALKSDLQKGAQFADIMEMMESMMTGEEPKNLLTSGDRGGGDGMYCLTNSEKLNGASLLLQDNLMQQIGGIVGSNFYVLPSSVHETLIVPDNGMLDLRELSVMVYDINRAEVEPQDWLSDNVQYYDTETRTLENAQDRQFRIEQEKPEKMSAKESRKGIHERLGEKKAQEKTAPKAEKAMEKAMEKAAKKTHDLAV